MTRKLANTGDTIVDDAMFSSAANGTTNPVSGSAIVSVDVPTFDAKTADSNDRDSRARVSAERSAQYREFRAICDDLRTELGRIDDYVIEEDVTEEGLEVVVEIEHLLEMLYDCQWGERECLKRVVVAVQAQVTNITWTTKHVEFLSDVVSRLRVRYLINDDVVKECYDLVEAHALDPFRGSVSEPEVRKAYRIEEVVQD